MLYESIETSKIFYFICFNWMLHLYFRCMQSVIDINISLKNLI